jgi:hypothetical protein
MHVIRTKWPARRHVDIRTMKYLRSERNKQVEKLVEEDARAVSWVFEDAAPSRKDRLAGQDEDDDFDDESDVDVGFEDDGVSANGTYVHAANDSDKQNESDPYMVSGGSEHDEEGAMESNFDELDAVLFGYDSDAQTPCEDKTEQLASLGSGFPSAPGEADANAETECDDKIEKLASLETRIPFERRKAEVGSQTGKKEKDAAMGSLERELDDEKSAKTGKLFLKILDIHGELRDKTADLDKAKHPILGQRHQNALNTIHRKQKTARAELASLDADMALVELAHSHDETHPCRAMPHWVPNLGTQNRKKPPFEMPGHRKGCDYDCGDADLEMDPAIEESLLRMISGRHCDYLRKIIGAENSTRLRCVLRVQGPVQGHPQDPRPPLRCEKTLHFKVPDRTGCIGGEGARCLN